VLNGNEAMKDKRARSGKGSERSLQAAEASLAPELATSAAWKKVVDAWATIEKEGLDLDPAREFSRRTIA
jgi:hypothetical protein